MERRNITKIVSQVGGVKLPAHISIKDNVFAAIDDAGTRVHIGTTLNCVILDANEKQSRIFWNESGEYDPDGGPPLCFSDNGIAPSTRALEPQAASCQPDREGKTGCRWSVWGSGRSKKTGEPIPACQNGVKLALMLVKTKGKEWIPMVPDKPGTVWFLRVPPGTFKHMASYGKVVQSMGRFENPWTGEVSNGHDLGYLITEIQFAGTGVLKFKAVGYITEQINGIIDEISDDRIDVAIGRDDEPIAALPAPAEPSPREELEWVQPGVAVAKPALPQPKAQVTATPRKPGRPRKNGNAPAASPAPAFEPKTNDRFVTGQEVRDHAAQQQQEAKEAQDLGISEESPEPPADVLDQFMNLDLK